MGALSPSISALWLAFGGKHAIARRRFAGFVVEIGNPTNLVNYWRATCGRKTPVLLSFLAER
jgi:hypothetical protein